MVVFVHCSWLHWKEKKYENQIIFIAGYGNYIDKNILVLS